MMNLWSMTDTGLVRKENQDAYAVKTVFGHTICVVCDGMGGAAGGKLASRIAVDTFSAEMEKRLSPEAKPDRLREVSVVAVALANRAVREAARTTEEYQNMGTTLVSAVSFDGGVVIANPNAPTGREMDFCDLRSIIEADPGRVVIVDEAYVDFGARSAVELIGRCPNLLVVRTFSKSSSLAGLRVGYAMGDEDLIAALNTVKDSFNSYPVDCLAQAGAIGAIRDKDYFRATVTKLGATRTCTANALRDMGFAVCDSMANFLFAGHERVGGKILLDGLRDRGILVRWWDKPRIRDYLRITIGTEEDMRALCEALEEILAENGG